MASSDFADDEVEEILFAALQRPQAQRVVFLDDRCGDRDRLRREIESLLSAHERAGGFIDPVTVAPTAEALVTARVRIGDRVGAFRLVDVIATGGMGTVFCAARVEGDFTQQVAIKFIGSWIRDPLAAQRFRTERQILATLQHPHIVSLLDGGVRDDGEAYLVMEYVEGTPITMFCQARASRSKSGSASSLRCVRRCTSRTHMRLCIVI